MCRLMAYLGTPLLASDLITKPKHSILVQSHSANERVQSIGLPGSLNADGFGIGWYTCPNKSDITPCTFTSISPAWSNPNLTKLCQKVESGLLFAHVRAAYPGIPVAEINCHPFHHGRYMWMHNGGIARFRRLRRKLLDTLSDEVYETVCSFHSDSAVCFSLFLERLYDGTPDWNTRQRSTDELLAHVEAVIVMVTAVGREQEAADAAAGVEPGGPEDASSLLNFVVSDGRSLVATRYASRDDATPASLYYALGSAFEARPQTKDYGFRRNDKRARACIVASEPVTSASSDWVAVPPQHALVVTRSSCAGGMVDAIVAPIAGTRFASDTSRSLVARALQALGACEPTQSGSLPLSLAMLPTLFPADGPVYSTTSTHVLTVKTTQPGAVTAVASGKNLLFAAASDSSIVAWDIARLEQVARLEGHLRPVLALALTGDEAHLLSCAGRTLRLWDLTKGPRDATCTRSVQLPKQTGDILALAVHGNSVALGLLDGSVQVYDFVELFSKTEAASPILPPRGTLQKPWAAEEAAAPSPARQMPTKLLTEFACAGGNGNCPATPPTPAELMNRSGTPFVRAQPAAMNSDAAGYQHVAAVNATAFVPGKRSTLVCSGGGDGHVLIWEHDAPATSAAPGIRCTSVLHGHRGAVLCLCALTCCSQMSDAAVAADAAAHGEADAAPMAWDAGGNCDGYSTWLVSGSADCSIRVWDVELRSCISSLLAHRGSILSLCALPARRVGDATFASCGSDGCVLLWLNLKCVGRLDVWPLGSHVSSEKLAVFGVSVCSPVDPGACPLVCCAAADGTVRCMPLPRIREEGARPLASGGAEDSKTHRSLKRSRSTETKLNSEASGVTNKSLLVPRTNTMPVSTSARSESAVARGASPEEQRWYDTELEAQLRRFIAIRTISIGSMHRASCLSGARFLVELLERTLGAEVNLLSPQPDAAGNERNPVVIGRVGMDASVPTLCFYGHYDVQPALEPDWSTPPWELSSVNGYLYGRGATDNKGPILAMVFALKELVDDCAASGEKLPCNVTFVVEGEEENGSGGFADVISTPEARRILGSSTDVVLISNTLWLNDTQPCLTWGMRGMMAISVEVSGPSQDVHSGNDGGVFVEPMADLVKVLGGLYVNGREAKQQPDAASLSQTPLRRNAPKAPSRRVAVRGFYDGVAPNTGDALYGCDSPGVFDTECYRQSIGVPSLCACGAGPVLRARWCEPSLSIVDIDLDADADERAARAAAVMPSQSLQERGEGSYRGGVSSMREEVPWRKFGPTRFSVVPRKAVGKVSIRFVPDQTPEEVSKSFEAHIAAEFAKLSSPNTCKVTIHSVGDWWLGNPANEFFRAARDALEAEWGRDVLFVREGGTMPVTSTLERQLACPALHLPLGQSTDRPHLSNERIRRENLFKGRAAIRRILLALPETCRRVVRTAAPDEVCAGASIPVHSMKPSPTKRKRVGLATECAKKI